MDRYPQNPEGSCSSPRCLAVLDALPGPSIDRHRHSVHLLASSITSMISITSMTTITSSTSITSIAPSRHLSKHLLAMCVFGNSICIYNPLPKITLSWKWSLNLFRGLHYILYIRDIELRNKVLFLMDSWHTIEEESLQFLHRSFGRWNRTPLNNEARSYRGLSDIPFDLHQSCPHLPGKESSRHVIKTRSQ